jgi:hypothetical protein
MGHAVRVMDTSHPTAPRWVGTCDTQGWAQEVALTGDYVYLADDPGGLLILRFSEDTQVARHSVPTMS